MIAAWLLARWGLARLDRRRRGRLLAAILVVASFAGTFVLARTGPYGSWGTIARMLEALQSPCAAATSARACPCPRAARSPRSRRRSTTSPGLSRSLDATKKQLDLDVRHPRRHGRGRHRLRPRGPHRAREPRRAPPRRLADDVLGKSAIEALRNATLAEAVDRALAKGEGGVLEVETGGVLSRRLIVNMSVRDGKSGGGVIAVLHDVTDLRRLETIRTEFVANVSHELRTPVTAITTAVETLIGGALGDPTDAAEFVEMIERNARRLRRLVDDILDLSKLEGKAYKLSPQVAPLRPVLAQARGLVQDAASRRGMVIEIDALPTVTACFDRHAFDQVIGNLLDNAVKYAGDRAVVTVSARAEGDAAVVTVADTGTGIPPQHLDRLFERFYRVDTGRSREMGGTGLGLSIVKHLVEAMGGSVTVTSALGRGTTFTLRLPARP
jgi:signal transduction histidine kinase